MLTSSYMRTSYGFVGHGGLLRLVHVLSGGWCIVYVCMPVHPYDEDMHVVEDMHVEDMHVVGQTGTVVGQWSMMWILFNIENDAFMLIVYDDSRCTTVYSFVGNSVDIRVCSTSKTMLT